MFPACTRSATKVGNKMCHLSCMVLVWNLMEHILYTYAYRAYIVHMN
jgi:hypothetical protein